MKTIISSCVFLGIVIVVVQSATPPPPPPPAIPHSKLAFQWPVTLCATTDCKELREGGVLRPPPEAFKLHGLWPTSQDWTKSLTKCPGDEFTSNPIQDIRASLRTYWPSFLEPENTFWRHEWEFHGRCSNLPLVQFFHQGLTLAKQHSKTLLPALAKSGIRPGSTTSTPAKIRDAIVQGLGVKCQLKCVEHTKGSYWLQEIYLCLDQHFTLQSCPDKDWHKGCGQFKQDKRTQLQIPIN